MDFRALSGTGSPRSGTLWHSVAIKLSFFLMSPFVHFGTVVVIIASPTTEYTDHTKHHEKRKEESTRRAEERELPVDELAVCGGIFGVRRLGVAFTFVDSQVPSVLRTMPGDPARGEVKAGPSSRTPKETPKTVSSSTGSSRSSARLVLSSSHCYTSVHFSQRSDSADLRVMSSPASLISSAAPPTVADPERSSVPTVEETSLWSHTAQVGQENHHAH